MGDSSALTTPASRPRRGLRFSLRALLLLVTLASVGLWYWFRVPFARDAQARVFVVHDDPRDPIVPRFGLVDSKQVQRYRRVLIGEPVREGLTKLSYPSGECLGEEQWRDGVLHGPWVRWYRRGQVMERGTFSFGKKHGRWEFFDKTGALKAQLSYDRGIPHGEAKWFDAGKIIDTVQYNQGEITHVDGRKTFDSLGRAYLNHEIDVPAVRDAIVELLWDGYPSVIGPHDKNPYRYRATPLRDALPYACYLRGVHLFVGRECGTRADAPIDLDPEYAPLGAKLLRLLEPHGLAAVYRHGCIWITTKEDAQSWVDRTGMSDLLKSPSPGVFQHQPDKLKQNLDRPLTVSFVGMSTADVASHLRSAERLPIDWVGTTNGPEISTGFRELPLRHILGAICEQNDLRIRWGNESALVLEPQGRGTP